MGSGEQPEEAGAPGSAGTASRQRVAIGTAAFGVMLLSVLAVALVLARRDTDGPVAPYPRAPFTDPADPSGPTAAGVERPADPSSVPGDAERRAVRVTQVRTAGDDRHLVADLDHIGGPPESTTGPSDPCADDFVVRTSEDAVTVTVTVERIDPTGARVLRERARAGWFCSAVGYFHQVAIELPSPLAGRVLLDGVDPGEPVPFLDAATVPEPAYVPPGCTPSGSGAFGAPRPAGADDGVGPGGTRAAPWSLSRSYRCGPTTAPDNGNDVTVTVAGDHPVDTLAYFPAEWSQRRVEIDGIPVDEYEIPPQQPTTHTVIARFADHTVVVSSGSLGVDELARVAASVRGPT